MVVLKKTVNVALAAVLIVLTAIIKVMYVQFIPAVKCMS
jgi:hypothetical protein